MPVAFVLMPFAAEFDDVYEHVIQATLVVEGFSVSRADEARNSRSIMHDVIQGIVSADLIVVDLTGTNPNVYYELGLAHAFGKKVILLTQDIEEVPFDLRAYRVVTYSTHFARVAEAKEQLLRLARGARDGDVHFGSPVSDFGVQTAAPPGRHTPPLLPPPVTSKDDSGPLDAAADLSEGMSGVSSVMSEVGQRFLKLNPMISNISEQMNGPLREDPRAIRELIRTLATHMNGFATWLKTSNGKYRSSLQLLTDALDAMFSLDSAPTLESTEQISIVVQAIAGIEAAAADSRKEMWSLADTLDHLPKIEKEFNRAKRQLSEEIHSLVSNVDQTIAVMSRARAAGQKLLGGEDAS